MKAPQNRSVILLAAVVVSVLCACADSGPGPVAAGTDRPVSEAATDIPAGQLGQDVLPDRYRLELKIDPRLDSFSGTTEIEVTLAAPTQRLFLHGKDLQVSAAWIDAASSGRIAARYEQGLDSGVAVLIPEQPLGVGPATLHLEYAAAFDTSVDGLFKVVRGADSYAVTQFEAISARQAFPGFDDPRFKTPFEVTLVTPAGDVAITNTREVSSELLPDGFIRRSFATTRPLPTYLLAFAVGPFDIVEHAPVPPNSVRNRAVPLRGIAARGLGPRLEYALRNTAGILVQLEDYFGTPYPYDKLDLIAVPEGFGGAMENPGAITYDEWLLLMDDDSALDQRRAYTAVHAHELAHQWFGNLVTPRWWDDIWLNEAFASWMAYKTASRYWPEAEFERQIQKSAIGAMRNDALASARRIREPVARNEDIAAAFDSITYSKGAGVLAMLERFVGEEAFREGVRAHLRNHADGAATAEDFVAAVAGSSGRSEIEGAFRSFIEQPGIPMISAEVVCETGAPPSITVEQSRFAPLGSTIEPGASHWTVPMCVSYDADGGRRGTCAILREQKQTIALDTDACPSRLHPNADGAGYYRFALDPTWMEGLLADAASLPPAEALSLADSLYAGFYAGRTTAESFVSGMAALLDHTAWDVADMAMDNLDESLEILQPDELEAARPALRAMVGRRFRAAATDTGPGAAMLRQRMQRFLAVVARDPDVLEDLAARAARRIGLDGPEDAGATTEEELGTALSAGVRQLGGPFFDLLLERVLASQDPSFREAAVTALSRTEDPVLAARLQSAVLDGRFKGTEMLDIVSRQIANPATRQMTFDWLRSNSAAVIDRIPGTFRSNILPKLGRSFCSTSEAAEWEAFVTSHAERIPGHERNLAQAMESIRLCTALKQLRGPELAGLLARNAL